MKYLSPKSKKGSMLIRLLHFDKAELWIYPIPTLGVITKGRLFGKIHLPVHFIFVQLYRKSTVKTAVELCLVYKIVDELQI